MRQAYLFFHLNLAFSSIPEEARSTVIKQCYWPLLRLIEQSRLLIGIEITGWTLQQVALLDPLWVSTLKKLLANQRCELIGSGWSQLIGPLVPYQVNEWNQKLALRTYQELLDYTPSIVLVNEMAFSSSLIELYRNAGYQGLIMDRDNIRLALQSGKTELPTYALGAENSVLPVLWSDSVLFQRLQRAVHGDIPLTQYFDYVQQRMLSEQIPLAIYANDAEIFDYRPGRFDTEGKTHPEGEWQRLQRIIAHLQQEIGLEFISPSAALASSTAVSNTAARLTSLRHPTPVKKQAKYNINRWAAAGRDNVWLNTLCHHRFKQLTANKEPAAWQQLCELWASDLRTHITLGRWLEYQKIISELALLPVKPPVPTQHIPQEKTHLQVSHDPENIYWHLETATIKLSLNLRRGLNIDSLAFRSWQFKPLLVTLHQGYFDTIELAADFYSGGLIIELPSQRRRLTDLEWVQPALSENHECYLITAKIQMAELRLIKTIKLSKHDEKISIHYQLDPKTRPEATIRLGIMTLNMAVLDQPTAIEVWQGGRSPELFLLNEDCDHSKAVSSLVSSSTSFGASHGKIVLGDQVNAVEFSWDPALSAAVPLLMNRHYQQQQLTRLFFSLSELDDTFKAGGHVPDFELTVSPGKLRGAIHQPPIALLKTPVS